MVSPLLLRSARPADRPAAEEALRACGAFNAVEVAAALDLFDFAMNGEYSLLAADEDGRLRGYACFGEASLTASSWYLYWLCVHPDAAGRGVGRALVAAVEDAVRSRGGNRLVVEARGRPDQEQTRRFYEKNGFVASGRIPDFYRPGDDCLIYWKPIEPAGQENRPVK
jgi:ribosomal protein S18 acetylase RimI-like enzyme